MCLPHAYFGVSVGGSGLTSSPGFTVSLRSGKSCPTWPQGGAGVPKSAILLLLLCSAAFTFSLASHCHNTTASFFHVWASSVQESTNNVSKTPLSGRKTSHLTQWSAGQSFRHPYLQHPIIQAEVTLGVATAMSPSAEELLSQHVAMP